MLTGVNFHQVLNRARWSALEVSRRLLHVLMSSLVGGGPLDIVIDETLERRWGRNLHKRGHSRDSLLSSQERSVSNSGLRWISMALVVTLPWTKLRWALPFFSVLATPPAVSEALGQRHQTIARLAQQMVLTVRSFLPEVSSKVIGDSAYSVIELGLTCLKQRVSLIAPLRLDARLFAPPPPRKGHQKGRPRVVGKRLPNVSTVLSDPKTPWETISVQWYGGTERKLARHDRHSPVVFHWDRATTHSLGAHARVPWTSSNREPTSRRIKHSAQQRSSKTSSSAGPSRVTYEESRAHLGVETQRQWSDLAIERSTPALLGLYSLVTLLGNALHPDGSIPLRQAAWYPKTQATFSDVLATVRRHLWGGLTFQTSATDPDVCLVPRTHLASLVQAVCY